MTERGTREDFGRWVEPHLTLMARYAARRVGPADRDRVVEEALIRAWQRRTPYDESRGTPEVWLLEVLGEVCRRPHLRHQPAAVVELVDENVISRPPADVDLEVTLDALDERDRQLVDLHYFVGLEVATVADVMHCEPGQVTSPLLGVRDTLGRLTGEDDERTDQRLRAAARRWQAEQPPPPEVPLGRLDEAPPRSVPWRRVATAAAAVVLVAGGGAAVVHASGRNSDHAPSAADPSPPPQVRRGVKTVPFRDLAPGHAALGHDRNGLLVTPYDNVTASGHIAGTVHPGDTFVFEVVLEAPVFVSLLPCPDYTITFGTLTTTHRLNCAEVPYFASLVRSDGRVTGFRPVLPAGTQVHFKMAVLVPDDTGRQEVSWTLDGPARTPEFSGVVEVTDAGTS